MPDPVTTFAANLRRLRQERGLTQEQLALDAGMDMADIGHIETQGREPKVTTIAKLAAALGVDPGELFDGVTAAADRSARAADPGRT
jgi:transcriptional regulator with XRE-family HTH domain